uniref:Uncharacterized protein n=1 Tax=Oreochromis aureus TaxID=47969 RepID=A0AAZ1XRG1_OREAU
MTKNKSFKLFQLTDFINFPQITKCWMLLFCLCCRYGVQLAAHKPFWMTRQFPCDVISNNASNTLETLNLGGNSLNYLDPSWFQSLTNLKELFLEFNFLQKAVTEKLDLSFNYALGLYPETLTLSKDFSQLRSLKSLHLNALVFQSIGPDTLRPLYNLKNLSHLYLSTNFIIHSDPTVFSKLSHLRMIYLGENRLYPTTVESLPTLRDRNNENSEVSMSPFVKLTPKDSIYEVLHRNTKQECFVGYGNISCLNLSRNGFSQALNGTEFKMLPNLTYLNLSLNRVDLAYNNAFKELKKLQVLDLSYNSHYFEAFGVTLNLNFTQNLPVLRVLNMSHNEISRLTTKEMYSKSLAELIFAQNHLGKLWKDRDGSYNKLFTNLSNLTILDISSNGIAKIPDDVYEYLPHNLTTLCISHNLLSDVNWDKLPFHQLQILDLSYNSLSTLTTINSNMAQTLTFLDLSHNHIFHADNCFLKSLKSLMTLSLSNNKLTIVNETTFESGPANLTLFLQGNPFECTCDLLDFVLWIEQSDPFQNVFHFVDVNFDRLPSAICIRKKIFYGLQVELLKIELRTLCTAYSFIWVFTDILGFSNYCIGKKNKNKKYKFSNPGNLLHHVWLLPTLSIRCHH